MRLRKECEHGAYDGHVPSDPREPKWCEGGEFLPEGALVASYFDDVVEFHRACSIPVAESPKGELAFERLQLRLNIMAEEWEELRQAMFHEDVVEIADACADLIVTVLGTAAEYGIPFDAVWAEVHRSNMAKVGGPVREDGKILKPPGWTPPDIASLIALASQVGESER